MSRKAKFLGDPILPFLYDFQPTQLTPYIVHPNQLMRRHQNSININQLFSALSSTNLVKIYKTPEFFISKNILEYKTIKTKFLLNQYVNPLLLELDFLTFFQQIYYQNINNRKILDELHNVLNTINAL